MNAEQHAERTRAELERARQQLRELMPQAAASSSTVDTGAEGALLSRPGGTAEPPTGGAGSAAGPGATAVPPSTEPVDGLVFNERMQERERRRRLAALGIRLVDPVVSDAVSSGAGGRSVSLPGAEDGPQSLSRPASLDREYRQAAESKIGQLLAELEAAEARLARAQALVEAARLARWSLEMLRHQEGNERATLKWARTVNRECARLLAAVFEWERS